VKMRPRVWIGDDVYLENEYPENVEIHEDVTLSIRAMIIAHTRGSGNIIIEKDVYVGPGVIIMCTEGKVIRIGQGAVLGAGSVITSSVAAQSFVLHPRCTPAGRARVPLATSPTMEAFMAGVEPLSRSSPQTVPGNESSG
jgi:acetyltransferase-like isoleucine patch superfamily enzyme